ncbi:MAG: hypothetical protein WC926_03210 [Candidatus Paceibacterota bacterium]
MDISQIRGSVLFVCSLCNLILGLILLGKARDNRAAFHLGILSLFSSLYAFVFGFFYFFDWQRLLLYRSTFFGVFLIPSFLNFVYIFSGNMKNFRAKISIWYSIAVVIVLTSLFTPYIVAEIESRYPYLNEHTHGLLSPYIRLYIIAGLVFSLYYLIKAYLKSTMSKEKRQLQYFIIGISIYSFMGVSAAGVLPLFFPKFSFIDLSVIFSLPWIGLTTYAILKDKLFDIKVLLTETLVYFFGIVLLFQVFFRDFSQEIIVQGSIFLVFCLIGYLLIKASRKDARRNEILEEKVTERTKDLRSSNQALEQSKKVAEDRAQELEKWYNLTVGRELRMAELKSQIKELEGKTK